MDKNMEVINMISEYGIEPVLEHFNNDINLLFRFLTKKQLWDYVDLQEFDDYDSKESLYKYWIKIGQNEKVFNDVVPNMSSVSFDGTDYFYEVRQLDEMAEWFSGSIRETSPRDAAKGVLGEDFWEPYSDTLYNNEYMSEVYDKLTPENQKYLRDVILNKYGNDLIGIPSEDITDTVLNIGTEDENGDYEFKIKEENILDLFSDDKLMNYLFKNYFDDITSTLENIYDNAYNGTYNVELSSKVWNELRGTFIDSDAEPISFYFAKRDYYKLKITEVLPELISKYIFSEYCENINNLGSYDYFIAEGLNCGAWELLSFRIHDYPNDEILENQLNDIFNNYF
jgi:hypothetical protein